jgi:hypothetical protein
MPKIGIVNIFIGFSVIVLASLAGFFLVVDAEKAFLIDKQWLNSWQYTLFKSAHGHLNLFGMLHILVGLTIPYLRIPYRYLVFETIGLSMGSISMGLLVFIRAYMGMPEGVDVLGYFIGVFLTCALGALVVHCYGLAHRLS